MLTRAVLTAAALVVLAVPSSAGAVTLAQAPGGPYSDPLYVTAPPGDPTRLLVVEQTGAVQLIKGGVRQATPFLDVSSLTTPGGEQGLLSIAFAPDYTTTGRLYAYYTTRGGNIQIDEFTGGAGSDTVPLATRRPIVTVDHPTNSNHNGGQLQFPQGDSLYAGTGDGGSGNDPPNNAQTPGTRLGKLLRIVPTANPPVVEEYASGLRNPWRFSFDRLNGDLTIGDVGQGAWEEIDFVPNSAGAGRGANFGWRCFEGFVRTANACNPLPEPRVDPVFAFDHSVSCSVTGGYVVRDPSLPSLAGRYVYGDYCEGRLRSLALAVPRAGASVDHGLATPQLRSFGEDAVGCVYAAYADKVARIAEDGQGFACPNTSALPPAPGPPPTGSPPPVPPVTPPPVPRPAAKTVKLSAAGQQRQKILRQTGIRIGVRCDKPCTARTRGSVLVGKKKYKLPRVSRKITTPNRTVVLVVPLPRAAKAAVTKALRRGRTALASVSLSARGLDGALDRESRRARLVR